jgi:hypothetical protein
MVEALASEKSLSVMGDTGALEERHGDVLIELGFL